MNETSSTDEQRTVDFAALQCCDLFNSRDKRAFCRSEPLNVRKVKQT